MSEKRIIRRHAHRFLWYACAESSKGRLLVVMSERGAVDVILGETRSGMLSEALRRFADTSFLPDGGRHAEWVAAIVKRLELPKLGGVVIPVDLGSEYSSREAG